MTNPTLSHPVRRSTGDDDAAPQPETPCLPIRPLVLATLLLGHTDSPSTSARCLGVLATDAQAPVVAETAVSTHLLQALQVITQLRVHVVGQDLAALAVDDIALSVKEPVRDLVLFGCGGCQFSPFISSGFLTAKKQRSALTVLQDADDPLQLFGGQLSRALVQVDIGLLAGEVAEWATEGLENTASASRPIRSRVQRERARPYPTPLIFVRASARGDQYFRPVARQLASPGCYSHWTSANDLVSK